MTDNITTKSFNRLLETLSVDRAEANRAYKKLRDYLVRFFQIKGDADPDQAADETLDRVSIKISQETKIDDLTKYSFGVARFVFLERLKRNIKVKRAAEGFYENKKLSEIDTETDDFALQRECFERLKPEEKEFLQNYFADLPFERLTEHRGNLTIKLDISLSNLRLKIFRLRQRLEKCVKNKLK